MIQYKIESKIVKINLTAEIMKNAEAYIREASNLILKYALEFLKHNESWVTGHLAKSGRVEFDKSKFEGTILFSAPYSAFVEFGTEPHIAPLGPSLEYKIVNGEIAITSTPDPSTNPLDFWAWRKGYREAVSTRYGVHTALGFGVWRKIMFEGTDAKPFLRPAIDRIRTELEALARHYGFEVTNT